MKSGEFAGGFKLSLARKDIGNALNLADGMEVPATRLVHELLLACGDYDDLDMAAM